MMELNGILLIDKPQSITSHDVVARLRRKLKIKKIGHTGTLDPMATSLMILMIGSATKSADHFVQQDKQYTGTITFGTTTDSQDAEGQVLSEQTVEAYGDDYLREIAQAFHGEQLQIPPMFSAKKINGVALYKLARKGRIVERPPARINIHAFALTKIALPNISFHIHCSEGTYIRTIAHDFGQKLGCGAHLSSLRRTYIGSFCIDQALSLETIEAMDVSYIQQKLTNF